MFDGQAWLASELAEELDITVEEVRRKMIILENIGLIQHVREGRFNWYFTTADYHKYLADNPEEQIRMKLKPPRR